MARNAWIAGIQLVFMTSYCCDALEGWLVAGKFQANLTRTPPCEALCFSIMGDHGSRNLQPGDIVGLYGCYDLSDPSNMQRWRYENNSLSVPATSPQDRLCLSASLQPNNSVFLERCNRSRSSQYWEVDETNNTIRNRGLYYLKTSGEYISNLQVSQVAESAFTLLVYQGSGSSSAASMGNGNFSRLSPWSYGQLPRVRGSFPYIVCDWTLGNNSRDLELRSVSIPGCPSIGLNLNGSGSVSQRISVGKGKQYSLSFQHGGLNNCIASGNVAVSGAAQLSKDFTSSSDVTCKTESFLFNSTADGDVVITIMGTGGDQGCGPVAGNVAFGIAEIGSSARTSGATSSSPTRTVLIGTTVGAVVAVGVGAVAAYWTWRSCCLKRSKMQQLDDKEVGPSLRRYTFQEIEAMTDSFSHLLGRGGFGSVFLATTTTGTQFAVKVFDREGPDFKVELSMLGRVHHRCIVSCHGYCLDRGKVYLVLEYMTSGSLSDHLHREDHQTLDWQKRVQIAKDVALGLSYLHHGADPPILHRDVKPANVLLHEDFSAKLADFGISRAARIATDGHVATTNSSIRGTLAYMDPQLFSSARIVSGKTDVYSYGILLLELITGVKPSFGEDIVEQVKSAEFFQDVVDPRLGNAYDLHELKCLHDTALLCVAEYEHRPIMCNVWDLIKDLGLAQENRDN